jgi:serine/threonine-protein kinase RsbW
MQFEFTSDYAEGRNVEKQILDAAQRCGFAGNTLFAIKLALEEAMINAIKHGNKLDPSKKVYVQAEVNAKRIKITIQDEGPGFKRHDVPDPTAEENLTKCSGRGILLMEAYMNQVKFTRRGRCVCMIKKNEAAEDNGA